MQNFSFKRMTAWLLTLVMLVGLVPLGIIQPTKAAGETIYVLAGGDFQEAGDHANSAANVTNILAQVSKKYQTMDGFLFIGDYDCETHNDATETANGITALMGAVQGSYSNLNDANSVLVQGNHDYMDSRIDATGGHEFNGYAAYVLNEDDYPNSGGSQSGIQTLANKLKAWLNNKIGEGYSEPIFIVSHLPLAFTPRTVTQGDAKYAKYIFDVLNDAGKNGLNIIFLHGHDHAYGPDNYMGGEAIYLPEGDKICIAEAGSTSAWTEETLNFTYMNAGYTGYYSDAFTYVTTAGTDKLTMTVFAITDNQVTVERYSEDGLYNLKSAGYDGSYSNTSVTNVSLGLPKYSAVYASPQTISLTQSDASEMGTIGEWVGVESETPADDVTPSNGGWVEVIAPVPETPAVPGTPESTKYVYTLDTDGTVTDKADAEQGYLIVGSGNNNYAMTDNLGRTGVTITDNAITLDAQPNYEWWITSDGKITDGTNWLAASIDWRSGSVSVTTNESNAYSWSISHSGNGAYQISGQYSGMWTTTYYLRYSNNSFSITSSTNTVRLFSGAEVTTPATEGTPAVPGTNGTYGKIAGELTYDATVGMTADQAMALVKNGIDGYYYEAMSTPGANVTGTKVDDSVLTWEWVDTFNGNTAGDYAVKISYNGIELGTAEVVVPASTTYYIAEGNGLYLVDMNTTESNAMAAVKAGVTVSSATDANGTNKTAISDNDVTWNWVDKYNGADSGPYTVEILKDGTSLGTVEVKVNIQYETGINSDWTYIGETEATGGSYTYTLDTDGIEYGEEHKYIIVDDNEAIVLNANSASNGTAHSITISGNTATLNTRDYEYHMIQTSWYDSDQRVTERYELITKGDGSQYLYQESNGVRYGTRSSVKFQVNHHGNGIYDIHDEDGTEWYIIYNGGWTVTETTSARVRLYKYTGTTGGTPGGPIYALIEGNTIYNVDQGSSATKALAAVKAGITGYIATDANGAGKTALADSDLTWKWKNTFNGNSTGSYWIEISYQGKVLGTVEVRVVPAAVDNYPEYPDEGAVKVNKTATGIDFQSSGIAQIEVSASGVPVKKGVDVIIMLDTSSSMTSHNVTGSSKTRAQVLEESLKDLIKKFKTPGDDGQLLDIQVAIADFNGFYGENHNASDTPYDRDAADMMSDDISYNADSEAQIYTGDWTLGAGAFIPAEDLEDSYTLNYTSGTNYDYAMDAIYQLATAKKLSNGTEDRDLYVIFMSDGAAMQWNYYHSQGASSRWNNWITGAWDADDLTTQNLNCTTHAHYYNLEDTDGDGMLNEHWMANAIKGDPTQTYKVIRKTNTLGTAVDGEENMYMVAGLGATMFSISFDAQADTNVTEESMDKSIETLATDQTGTTKYYYKVTTAEELSDAFDVIGTEIAYAANNARFVDQMGSDFDLQLATSTYEVLLENGSTEERTIEPTIEILSYDIYTKAEADAEEIPDGKNIGDRKGTSTLNEVVMFDATGTRAYSNKIDVDKDGTYGVAVAADGTYSIADADDNIIGANGVIYAISFLYNTSASAVTIDKVDIPTGIKTDGTTTGTSAILEPETFYWNMGTVKTSELAMRYYVYLENSMGEDGGKAAGSYATNNFATLYYDNHLGNHCKKDTISPMMAWKAANVSYGFYLVNSAGQPVNLSGEIVDFSHRTEIIKKTFYEEVLLNQQEHVISLSVISEGVLPDGYALYDEKSAYTVTINSNGTGKWEITKSSDVDVASTYVTDYKGAEYTNVIFVNSTEYEYTHTTVWFAVKWEPQALDDTIVIDYGQHVDINILGNDMFGNYGKLVGIKNGANNYTDKATTNDIISSSATGDFGTAKIQTNGEVRYTLDTAKGMQMNDVDVFTYAVNYVNASFTQNNGFYYGQLTIIPATTIYYEETFVTFINSDKTNANLDSTSAGPGEWFRDEEFDDATQEEDRPGFVNFAADIDHNNVYGYDGINKEATKYSLGSAVKVTVDANTGRYYGLSDIRTVVPKATFTFTGTGFDIISLTDYDSGVIIVDIVGTDGTDYTYSAFVDNYYGYTYTNGKWEVVTEAPTEGTGVIWQVPVIKKSGLDYGTYTVTISVAYIDVMNHVNDGSYSFWLDSIRIYDPAGVTDEELNETIKDAYVKDNEYSPCYVTIRDVLVSSGDLNLEGTVEGVVFIDGNDSTGNISEYANQGPNNETYLASGQGISFRIVSEYEVSNNIPGSVLNTFKPADVQIGAKLAFGDTVTFTVNDRMFEKTLVTKTDMYYSIPVAAQMTPAIVERTVDNEVKYYLVYTSEPLVVLNTSGDGVLSLTNIKVTDAATTYTVPQTTRAMPMADAYAEESYDAAVQNTVKLVVDMETVEYGLKVVDNFFSEPEEIPEEEPVFEPEVFEFNITPGIGKKKVLTVITSTDVAKVTVNGKNMTKLSGMDIFKVLSKAMKDLAKSIGMDLDTDDHIFWTRNVTAADEYTIIAKDATGLETAPVTIDAYGSTITMEDIEDAIRKANIDEMMQAIAEKVFNPKHFESKVSKRSNGHKEAVVKTSEDVEYVIVNGEIVDHYITETVINLDTDETTVSRVFVSEVEDENVEVTAYNEEGTASSSENLSE
ncbi:MAG: hypothetical protein E7658_05360 [Ruminococcaceae bacterium]|nr:hypothetical protein [Oscillospiraceae bacterium]